ncbi:2962_t:CDS:1 [Acaulospora colombiana]|uniref:2962_t:CDS:1 n=1 Tax=Acaulospora colombiana TaxID=27376 RepID=A0ACA9PUF7_9GLOM|nr:2962_t:CDS:1 [Acaulospora colombiana]
MGISTHKVPFNQIDNIRAGEKIKSGKRPKPFSEDTSEKYKRIVKEAWHDDRNKRPTIEEILEQLDEVKKDVDPNYLSSLEINEAISLHEKKQYKKAFRYFRELAYGNDHKSFPLASYYAGLYFFEGTYGIEKDEFQALYLLKKSAICGVAQAQYKYAYACLKGRYYSQEEGLKYLKKSALGARVPEALYMISQLFLNGEHGYPIDNKKYIEYLIKAADRGSKEAQQELMKERAKNY